MEVDHENNVTVRNGVDDTPSNGTSTDHNENDWNSVRVTGVILDPVASDRPPVPANRHDDFQIPIIGYEIMEERARFTIFKLRIDDPRTGLSWMVFRRYTDFVRLHSRLKEIYPNFNVYIPGKRRFKDNFDPSFLDERARGLQLFVNGVIKRYSGDVTVREFFCLDEPPPVGDSEPESLALFGALEDTVGSLKSGIRQRDETIEYLRKKVAYLEDKMRNCNRCNIELRADAGYRKNAASECGSNSS